MTWTRASPTLFSAYVSRIGSIVIRTEWKPVADALGRKGSMQPGEVYKFSMPRSDLKVTVAGTPIKAGLALGSWVAFKRMGTDAMVMGDLVLTEAEVQPVMAKLQEEGVEQIGGLLHVPRHRH